MHAPTPNHVLSLAHQQGTAMGPLAPARARPAPPRARVCEGDGALGRGKVDTERGDLLLSPTNAFPRKRHLHP